MRKRRGKGWIGEGGEEKRRNKERETEIRRKRDQKNRHQNSHHPAFSSAQLF